MIQGDSAFGYGLRTCPGVPLIEADMYIAVGAVAWGFSISPSVVYYPTVDSAVAPAFRVIAALNFLPSPDSGLDADHLSHLLQTASHKILELYKTGKASRIRLYRRSFRIG